MPACYWDLCHCPDALPCAEHQGWYCGLWNGQVIEDPHDIKDELTRDADLALIRLDADQKRRNEMQGRLEARSIQLERDAEEVRQKLASAREAGERREVIDLVLAGYRQVTHMEMELRQTLVDLDALNSRATAAGNVISTYLIVPYTSPRGYCACYTTKQGRLAAITSQSDAQRAMLATLGAQRGVYVAEVLDLFRLMPSANSTIQGLNSIGFALAIAAYFLFGAMTAGWVALCFLLAVAYRLVLVLAALSKLDEQITSVRGRMVKLDQVYYRLQSISTCAQPSGIPTPTDSMGFVRREHAWIRELGIGEPVPEEGPGSGDGPPPEPH